MKYITMVLLGWMTSIIQTGQDIYICKNVKVTFFSSAPIEDIKAVTTGGASVFNASTGQLDFSVPIRSFQFDRALMQEHFNSDYLESDKFPRANFKGRLSEHIDAAKDGTYQVKAVGDLTVHGVTRPRTIPGTVTVKGGIISMTSEFIVKCVDHHIDIPQIVFHHIAESIKVNIYATFSPYKNNQTNK